MDSLFGELERFGSEVIYPNRWLFLALTIVAAAGLIVVAYVRRWHTTIWRHRLLTVAIAAPALLVAIPAGWYALSPVWERSFLEEEGPAFDRAALGRSSPAALTSASPEGSASASPSVTATIVDATPDAAAPTEEQDGSDAPATPDSPQAQLVAVGEWAGADDFHFARGNAFLLETAQGETIVRLEDFSVRNGPDLFVYLSPAADGFADGAINLGELKATDGAFNYDVPPGTDIGQFRSVVVWCRQFSVLFGTATLESPDPR